VRAEAGREHPEVLVQGIVALYDLLVNGPDTVRELIAKGEPHLALAQAHWLLQMRHPQGAVLVAEAWQAVRAAVVEKT
jgi:hypothetical protein